MRVGPAQLPVPVPQTRAEEQLWQAAQGFEALLLSELLKGGRGSLPGGDLGGDGEGGQRDTLGQSLLDRELATRGAARGGLGIAAAVYRQFQGALGGGG